MTSYVYLIKSGGYSQAIYGIAFNEKDATSLWRKFAPQYWTDYLCIERFDRSEDGTLSNMTYFHCCFMKRDSDGSVRLEIKDPLIVDPEDIAFMSHLMNTSSENTEDTI